MNEPYEDETLEFPEPTTPDLTKHTPGPWRYTDGGIIDNKPSRGHAGLEIADVYGVDCYDGRGLGDANPQEAKANARLIAAAPEMLKELMRTKLDAEMALSGAWDRDDHGFRNQIRLIDALIAKIEEDKS